MIKYLLSVFFLFFGGFFQFFTDKKKLLHCLFPRLYDIECNKKKNCFLKEINKEFPQRKINILKI